MDVTSQREPELSESQARRASALKSALGPLTELLDDPRVVEVMLNADGVVWVERVGEGVVRTRITVCSADADRVLRPVASEVLVELNPQSPSLSAKLPQPWGARLQAAIPPIADAPVFALRKPARIVFSLDDYVSRGILTPRKRCALADAVRAHDNILIGGGTGSGKTTFANALVKVIAEDTTDRVHIVEDTPELQCEAPNRLQVLVQPGVHSWRDAIMAAMRFRPDRILVGEVRDGSALELLKAWNTGHPGGIATIHANDTRVMLVRLCQLIEEVVHPAPRALVAQSIQLCVHIQRDKAHPAGRRVSGIDRVGPLSASAAQRELLEKLFSRMPRGVAVVAAVDSDEAGHKIAGHRRLFAYVRTGRHPSALPDTFYTRLGAMLGGRLPGHKILLSLLAAEHPWRARESSAASKAKSVAPAAPAPSTRAPGPTAASTEKPC